MNDLIKDLKNRLETLNVRTAYALIALGFTLGIVLILNISDSVAVAKAERDVVEQRLAQYGDGLDLEIWQARANQAAQRQEQWETLYWAGSAPGIIATQIQGSLNAISKQALLENVRYGADPILVETDGQSLIRFQLTARSSDGIDVITALGLLANATPALAVKDITINIRQNDSAIFNLSGVAPVSIVAPPAQTNPAVTGGR